MSSTGPPSNSRSARTVSCPRCGAAVVWSAANAYRPFCSERCKQIDLGAWADEQYRVAEPADPLAPPEDEELGGSA